MLSFSKILIHCSQSALAIGAIGSIATPAWAQTSAVAPAPDAEAQPDAEITVTGKRSTLSDGTRRPIEAGDYALTKGDWSDVLSGSSALALVKNLPGVTFTSTDAYGLDLSDGFLLVRGFRQNELAITLEGIPLNDGSYGSVTGTAPLNIGVAANIDSVRISPGSAAVSTFSNTGNGGEMRYAIADPKPHFAMEVTQGLGGDHTLVTSATVNTGRIGEDGPRMLFGIERISKDKYTGAGTQYMLRANAKLVQDLPWGDLTAFLSFARAEIWGYNNTSFDMLAKLGWNGTDIFYPNYARAVFIAAPENASKSCGAYSCGELASLIPYDTGQATGDFVGNITHRFNLTDRLSGSVTGYAAISKSDIEISDVSTPSQTGAPFSSQVWQTRPRRFGGTADLSWKGDRHTISVGAWVERTSSTSRFAYYNQPLPGQGAPLRAIGPYDVYGPAFQIANDSRWRTRSFQLYVRDVFKPSDALTIDAGFKSVNFSTSGGGIGPDRAPNGTLRTIDPFLPHLAIDWHPDAGTSLYLDIAKTAMGYRVSSRGNIGPVSSAWAADNQELFDAARATLKPEKDWNFTVGGYRRFGALSINIDAYYGIILNRLLNGTSGPQFNPVRTVGIVPRSELIGADAIVDLKPAPWLDISQSVSVSKLRYADDLVVAGEAMPLKGHFQPGYPGVSLISQVSAKRGRFEAGATSTLYLDDPFTYSNDIHVPAYWQVNAHASYRLPKRTGLPELLFRLDVSNLLDRHNIGSVGIGGYSVSGDYQTFMRAAPRTVLFSMNAKI
ncbi:MULTISPECIES: TonB-dependent receptor [unclassified Sphingomonas]|nr:MULTISPECIES: TonB-dependent receptor [unclassified Sphingomonas]